MARCISSARQSAKALRSLAGDDAYWLFTLGVTGTGMLGVPVLAGFSACAIAEVSAWRKKASGRAAVLRSVLAAMISGLANDFIDLDAVKMMLWSAVVNGMEAHVTSREVDIHAGGLPQNQEAHSSGYG
jgi:Mn2+/Fe2+ NRAMP family transporter